MSELCDFGLIGLAVMGENLALNVESRGFRIAVFNRTVDKVDALVNGRAKGKKFVGCHSLEELVKNLKRPRKVMMLVKAGDAGAASECILEVVRFYRAQEKQGEEVGDTGHREGGGSGPPDDLRRERDRLEPQRLRLPRQRPGPGCPGGPCWRWPG